MYTELETKALSKFFTNLESNIYCATDNMPTSLWAFLTGGYSRSELNMRDRFLAIFKEMDASNYESILLDIIGDDRVNQAIEKALSKSEQFMRKWAIQYSHASLKDSAVDRIAIENVSIRATKILEDSQLGAFQEKSTRYMDFSNVEFYVPESECVTDEHRAILTKSMDLYRKMLDRAIEYFKSTIDRSQFTSEAAWLRTCKARAFDEARYALPTAIKTSLGATLPTRETERWIAKMLAHPEKEIRDIATLVKQECVKVNPGLLRHVDANPYLHQRSLDISETVRKKALEGIKSEENRTGMSLITRANDPVAVLTAFCADIGLHTPGEISAAGDESLSELMDSILRSRGLFDAMPNWTAAGELEFCITIDIGAYRDIQRHRVGTQTSSDWAPLYGYSIPDFLGTDGQSDLLDEYVALSNEIQSSITELYKNDRYVAGYFMLLGTNIRLHYVCNFKQYAYFVELRSGASGHYSYRKLAQKMYASLPDHWAVFNQHVRCDQSEYSDRRVAEERIQEKLKALQAVE
jgi:thymidylate synthase ThyX